MTHEEYDNQTAQILDSIENFDDKRLTHEIVTNTLKSCLTVEEAINHLKTLPPDMIILGGYYEPVNIAEYYIKGYEDLRYIGIREAE